MCVLGDYLTCSHALMKARTLDFLFCKLTNNADCLNRCAYTSRVEGRRLYKFRLTLAAVISTRFGFNCRLMFQLVFSLF